MPASAGRPTAEPAGAESPRRRVEGPAPAEQGATAFEPSGLFAGDDQKPLGQEARHRKSSAGGFPWLLAGTALVLVVAIVALVLSREGGSTKKSVGKVAAPTISQPADPNDPFYLVPGGPAAQQMAQYSAEGRDDDAAAIQKIASEPVAKWFAYDGADVANDMKKLVKDAVGAKRQPVIVAYYLPHRDCGQYSSGGAPNAAAYKAWIDKLAAATKGQSGYLILEPDAIAHTLDGCLTDAQSLERYGLLWYAVKTLKADSKFKIYLDAGNSAWIASDKMTQALYAAGLENADGFSLNVSNFQTTEANIAYGEKIVAQTKGKHFVIDTSRNGNGPTPEKSDDLRWCNPPGRALGTPPTTDTGNKDVDAFLWVKQPGTSDGPCRDGAPKAGQWWADYALGLAKAA